MRVVHERGGVIEAEHEVSAVLVREDGRVVEAIGEVDRPVTWRSAAKPFQLEVSAPLTGRDWTDRELAVGASSHWGQDVHVELVRGILAANGNTEEHLFCGGDWPGHPAARRAAMRTDGDVRAIWNNCSGKHAFMAGACRACGWEPDYRDAEHPLQRRIRANVAERTGHPESSVVDGCGLPCFVLPITAMGRAWAGLAVAVQRGDGLLGRIGAAMMAHPTEAGADGALDSTVMARATRPLVAKVGAEGLICVAVPGEGAAVVLKLRSGNDLARAIALPYLLDRWFPGALPADALAKHAEVRNVVGRVVGVRRVVA